MNVLAGHPRIDKGYLDSLLKQGVIDTSAYNMLNGGRTGYEEEEDPWGGLGLKKKDKKSKKRKVGIPFENDSAPPEPVVDDSVPQEPVDAKKVPEAEPNEAWDVVPSPPSQPPKDGYEEVQSAENARETEDKNGEVKQVDAAGWAFTWCFRCKRVDVFKFGGKTLPEWFITNLNYEGNKAEPIVLPVCCMMSNNEHRQATVSAADEEKKLRQAFETLRVS